MAWTEAQQKVIDTRNKNLLVSAAAGSGKTAVLVERIISMISDGEHPIDIDHLLVVTFTNAAAAEMRGRIGKAIDEKLLKEPDSEHLQKQISLLQSAQITTIHSFCLNVIRNYFHRIDLDPSFKIAEESEITLMKSDVMADVLERWYEEGREDFHSFIESYSYSKSDAPVEELVLQLYNFSMSSPWPKVWLSEKEKAFEVDTLDEMVASEWMKELLHYVKVILDDLMNKNKEALEVCNTSGGPTAYIPALLSDREVLTSLRNTESYEDYAQLFAGVSYARLSGKKEEGVLPHRKDRVKELREEVKKGLKDLTSQFFFQSPQEMLKDLQSVRGVMKVLFELTIDFMEEFASKKEEKNLIDFNDLEHFALKILVEDQDGVKVPSHAAMELSEQFEEILIDEYQDSNMVQETILKSISRERLGKPNRFMVGDVKQSIYKFRLAMPELFMEKYRNYSVNELTEEGNCNLEQRIDLDRNFRSRKVVLDCVNKIFEQIMTEPVGGIVYDTAASLKYGELFEETLITASHLDAAGTGNEDRFLLSDSIRERLSKDVELMLVTEEELSVDDNETAEDLEEVTQEDFEHKDAEDEQENAVYTKKEIEARAIARRIKELTHPKSGMLIFDGKSKTHRPVTYRDIVILLRSMTGWSEVFVNTLMQEGIPAFADTGTGYFQTLEIMTLLNMLRIIDNPRQDIPLTGILYSPMVGITTTELALIRAFNRNSCMYTAVLSYAQEGTSDVLRDKLALFLEQLDKFRSMVNHVPIHELIEVVLDITGYGHYVSAMPGGERRKANIDMLVSQATRFEKGSYSGLFHFIRYIEKLHKYEIDFGEAVTSGEQDDTVRIMSIHKSKGLEFPVVVVAGMSKQFNTQDQRSNIILHNNYGAGPEYIDSTRRTKVPTLLKRVIQKKVQIENLGEELRVLYVAMTRAREKLILSGYLKSLEDIKEREFSFFEITSAKCYLEWVMPAMLNCIKNNSEGISDSNLTNQTEGSLVWKTEGMRIDVIDKAALLKEELTKQIFKHKDEDDLLAITPEKVYDSALREEIKTRFNYEYPFRKEAGLRVKMTVSELKKMGQFIDEEQSVNLYEDQKEGHIRYADGDTVTKHKTEPDLSTNKIKNLKSDSETRMDETEFLATVPNFIRQREAAVSGTDRGTLYHKVLELLDLTKVRTKVDLEQELERMMLKYRLCESDIRKLKQDYIFKFTQSDVAERMRKAQSVGKLYKEKQFVIGMEAQKLIQSSDSKELILIQGIIDVFFEEDNELVLLDYKSDIVNDGKELIKKYRVQLDYYRKALEQMLNKRVKEMILYSLHLGQEIRIDEDNLVTL